MDKGVYALQKHEEKINEGWTRRNASGEIVSHPVGREQHILLC